VKKQRKRNMCKTPVVLGNARFTVYRTGCVRLEYAKNGQFCDDPSVLVGKQLAKPIRAEVKYEKKSLRILTDKFELQYLNDGKCFSAGNLKILHRDVFGNDQVWAPGKADKGNLGSTQRCLDHWKWCGGPAKYPVEGILSTDGGHFLPDEPRVYWDSKYDWPANRGSTVEFDGYFFAYGDDYKPLVSGIRGGLPIHRMSLLSWQNAIAAKKFLLML